MEIEFENFASQDCSKLLSKTKTQIRDRKELSYNNFMAIFSLLMKFGTRKCLRSTTFQKLLHLGQPTLLEHTLYLLNMWSYQNLT